MSNQNKTTKEESRIRKDIEYRLWSENTWGKFKDVVNGVKERPSFDPHNNKDDQQKVEDAVRDYMVENYQKK